MPRKIKTALFVVIIAFLALGLINALRARNYFTPTERVVEQKARRVFLFSNPFFFLSALIPYDVDIHQISAVVDLWPTASIFNVRGYLLGSHPHTIEAVIAVTEDGRTVVLPDKFNELLKAEHIVIENEETALKVAHTYVNLLGAGVLESLNDIPHEKTPVSQYYETAILPPNVRIDNDVFVVSFVTWKILGGVLERWAITMDAEKIIRIEKEPLGENIGDFIEGYS